MPLATLPPWACRQNPRSTFPPSFHSSNWRMISFDPRMRYGVSMGNDTPPCHASTSAVACALSRMVPSHRSTTVKSVGIRGYCLLIKGHGVRLFSEVALLAQLDFVAEPILRIRGRDDSRNQHDLFLRAERFVQSYFFGDCALGIVVGMGTSIGMAMTVAVGLGGAFADSTAISVSGRNDGLRSPCPYPQHHQHAPQAAFHHTWSLKPSLAPIAPSSLIVLSVCVSSTDCWPASLKPLSLSPSLTPPLSHTLTRVLNPPISRSLPCPPQLYRVACPFSTETCVVLS
mmetsp:Transcript_10690/g.28491  ORF Transcript_10690/g.28491 Transcript_10690/m.28491 type:complete len:286 (-) Transcript_10690:8-865(-)